jgi:hypothetical protein
VLVEAAEGMARRAEPGRTMAAGHRSERRR